MSTNINVRLKGDCHFDNGQRRVDTRCEFNEELRLRSEQTEDPNITRGEKIWEL
jgi:hypothetical protein